MSLENRYRRLLRAYPHSYRERRGEEMIATLLDGAAPGQTRPTRREVTDLLSGALRERLGLHAVAGFAAGLRMAGPVCLALAAGSAVSDWQLGTRGVASSVVAAGWLLAVLTWVAMPRRGLAPVALVALAWLVTLGTTIGTDVTSPIFDLGNGYLAAAEVPDWYALELTCGLVALLAFATTQALPSAVERMGVAAALAGLAASTIVNGGIVDRQGWHLLYPLWTRSLWLLPVTTFAVGLALAARYRTTGWLWASLLLALPVPLTQVWRHGDYGDWHPPVAAALSDAMPGIAEVVLLAVLVVVAVYLTSQDHAQPTPGDGRAALAAAGTLCLGLAGGLCGYMLASVMYHRDIDLPDRLGYVVQPGDVLLLSVTVVAVLVAASVRTSLGRPVIVLATAAMALGVASGRTTMQPEMVAAVSLLLLAAAATARAPRTIGLGAAAATAVLVGGMSWIAFGGPMPWPNGIVQSLIVPSVAAVVLAPTLWWASVVAVRATHHVIGAVVAFAASLLWLVLIAGPAHDSRVIAGTVGSAVALLLAIRLVLQHTVTQHRAVSPSAGHLSRGPVGRG